MSPQVEDPESGLPRAGNLERGQRWDTVYSDEGGAQLLRREEILHGSS